MIFFNVILRAFLEGYMNYAISSLMNITDVRKKLKYIYFIVNME
jgi:hypothetical protein